MGFGATGCFFVGIDPSASKSTQISRVFSLTPLDFAHSTDGSKTRARVYASVKGKTKSGWSLILNWCAGFSLKYPHDGALASVATY